jgi:hypothetical protein
MEKSVPRYWINQKIVLNTSVSISAKATGTRKMSVRNFRLQDDFLESERKKKALPCAPQLHCTMYRHAPNTDDRCFRMALQAKPSCPRSGSGERLISSSRAFGEAVQKADLKTGFPSTPSDTYT